MGGVLIYSEWGTNEEGKNRIEFVNICRYQAVSKETEIVGESCIGRVE